MLIDYKSSSEDGELLVFLHIPKTAGVSMHNLLQSHFGDRYFRHSQSFGTSIADLDEDQCSRLSCVSGHFRFGVHRKLGREALYFTVVRDPIQRLISLYNHKRRRGRFRDRAIDDPPDVDDWMTGKMAGCGRKVYSQCEAICGVDDFEQAKAYLERHYLLYADLSQLDAMAVALQHYIGHEPIQALPRLNVRPPSQLRREPSDGVRAQLREFLTDDLRLVKYCREAFRQRFGE